jgi:hypothetical protein
VPNRAFNFLWDCRQSPASRRWMAGDGGHGRDWRRWKGIVRMEWGMCKMERLDGERESASVQFPQGLRNDCNRNIADCFSSLSQQLNSTQTVMHEPRQRRETCAPPPLALALQRLN